VQNEKDSGREYAFNSRRDRGFLDGVAVDSREWPCLSMALMPNNPLASTFTATAALAVQFSDVRHHERTDLKE
jgi:hypothetical protein